MSWTNVKLIFCRELRDQLRDRRTLFTIAVLPVLLYPLLAMVFFQVQQFRKDNASVILVIGAEELPADPPLFAEGHFSLDFCPLPERQLLQVELKSGLAPETTASQIVEQATVDLRAGAYDAVVYFPREFSQRLSVLRQHKPESIIPGSTPQNIKNITVGHPEIYLSTASDKSQVARDRLSYVLDRWRTAIVVENLKENHVPPQAAAPFELSSTDVAEPVRARAAIWSKILPFVLLVWALTGAFYPAIDLCAGEKERGTLETLLSSPAQRSEIVWGKLLTVMAFSMATSLLNLASMGATGSFIAAQLEKMSTHPLPVQLGPPPLFALCWLLLALIPISAMFSALSLAIAAFARSSKEGQYYLLPLLMISLPLMTLPLLPNAQLDLGSSLIPLTGLMLLLRALIEGQYLEALKYLPFVTAVTTGCCWFAIRWAVHQFNNESVLFRESERFHLGLWVRQLVLERDDAPSVGEAVSCGVLLLVIRFFSNFLIPSPTNFGELTRATLVVQIALIAFPACLMAIMLTRQPLGTLGLRRPSFWSTLPAAVLLAALLHPAVMWLSYGIEAVYPKSEALKAALGNMSASMSDAKVWQLVLLIGLLPAVCEELAFRGFILNGLRRTGHKWGAIVLTSALFGIVHMLLQQSLSAFLVGIVIGYVAVKTNSLFPAMLFHFTHNSLAILTGTVTTEAVHSGWPLNWLFIPASDLFAVAPFLQPLLAGSVPADGLVYNPLAVLLALAGAVGILLWLKRLPYHSLAEERLQQALDCQTTIPGTRLASSSIA